MKVVFDRSFLKSLQKLDNPEIKRQVEKIILEVETTKSLKEVSEIRKMKGFKSFYRIRAGEYRIGIGLEANQTVRFILIAHRKDIYRLYP